MKLLDGGIAIIEGDQWIGRWVQECGKLCHDATVPLHILPLLKAGDVVVDAGANIGTHTVAYSGAVGDTGKVFAFEPNPVVFECLIENTRKLTNVICHRVGLSDKGQCLGLWIVKENIGASYLRGLDAKHDYEVQCWDLDNYDLAKVNFIKLDIEGYEFLALCGMTKTLTRHRPIVLLEMNRGVLDRVGHIYQDIFTFLREFNYSFKPLTEDQHLDDDHYDLLATPK